VPMMTLEELDNNKRGMSEVSRNARQVSRTSDESDRTGRIADRGQASRWRRSAIDAAGGCSSRPKRSTAMLPGSPAGRQGRQPDHRRGEASAPERQPRRQVVLVSKDINMRIKARALGLPPRTTSTTRCSRTPTCSTPARSPCPPTSGTGTASNIESWQQAGSHLLPGQRSAVPDDADQRIRLLETGETSRSSGAGQGTTADGGAADAARLRASQERGLGHRRRATASRIRPQPADESPRSTS
jgi:predicted ribonuclease YlaK